MNGIGGTCRIAIIFSGFSSSYDVTVLVFIQYYCTNGKNLKVIRAIISFRYVGIWIATQFVGVVAYGQSYWNPSSRNATKSGNHLDVETPIGCGWGHQHPEKDRNQHPNPWLAPRTLIPTGYALCFPFLVQRSKAIWQRSRKLDLG